MWIWVVESKFLISVVIMASRAWGPKVCLETGEFNDHHRQHSSGNQNILTHTSFCGDH